VRQKVRTVNCSKLVSSPATVTTTIKNIYFNTRTHAPINKGQISGSRIVVNLVVVVVVVIAATFAVPKGQAAALEWLVGGQGHDDAAVDLARAVHVLCEPKTLRVDESL